MRMTREVIALWRFAPNIDERIGRILGPVENCPRMVRLQILKVRQPGKRKFQKPGKDEGGTLLAHRKDLIEIGDIE